MAEVRDTHEYQQGTNVQRKFATWLARRHYLVARVNDDAAMAPMAEYMRQRVVLPDLLTMGPKLPEAVWLDVKYKTLAPMFYAAGIRTTGIDRSSYRNYEEVERVTAKPVLLVFAHRDEDEVRVARLGVDVVPSSGIGDAMVYWHFDALRFVTTFGDLDAVRVDDSLLVSARVIAPEWCAVQLAIPGLEL